MENSRLDTSDEFSVALDSKRPLLHLSIFRVVLGVLGLCMVTLLPAKLEAAVAATSNANFENGKIKAVASPAGTGLRGAAIRSTKPSAGTKNFPPGDKLAVRFNSAMDVSSLNAQTVTLIGPDGQTPFSVDFGESNSVLYITPSQDLIPASRYTLFVKGATNTSGKVVPLTAIGFNTSSIVAPRPPRDSTSVIQVEKTVGGFPPETVWQPDLTFKHAWASGQEHWSRHSMPRNPMLRRAIYPPLRMAPAKTWATVRDAAMSQAQEKAALAKQSVGNGPTSLSGQVLRLNGMPLANVTLRMGSTATRTDDNGEFLLQNIPAGQHELVIDGRSASRPGATYGRYVYLADIKKGRPNSLPFVIWMQLLDVAHAIKIDSPTKRDVVITNPNMPGFEMVLPKGSVIRDTDGKIVTEVSITPQPTDQTPFPMPYLGIFISSTIQPGGATITGIDGKPRGAVLHYPNYTTRPANSPAWVYDYDPHGRGWYIYSAGKISPDRKKLIPDKEFVIYQFSAASGFAPPPPPFPPPNLCQNGQCCGAGAGGPGGGSGAGGGGGGGAGGPPGCGSAGYGFDFGGEPVDLSTGIFEFTQTDLVVNDIVPIKFTRTYRTLDQDDMGNNLVGPFGYGTMHPYEIYLTALNEWQQLAVIMPNGARHIFQSTTAVAYYDGSIYQDTTSPDDFYSAYLLFNSNEGWVVYFRDGRRWALWGGAMHAIQSISWTEDRNGNRVTVTRPEASAPATQITGPTGRFIQISYMYTGGPITQISDNIGRTVTYSYDGSNTMLQSVTDPLGHTANFTWDTTNLRITSIADKDGNTTVTNSYDGNGRVSGQTLADSSTFGFAYTLSGGSVTQTAVTDRRGNTRQVVFSSAGFVTSDTYPVGLPEQQTLTYVLDSATGRITSKTDSLSRETTYHYDSIGNLSEVTDLAGTSTPSTILATFDPIFSKPTSATDANGHTSTFAYDDYGNLTQITNALSNSITRTVDVYGRTATIQDPLGDTTSVVYSGAFIQSSTDPLGRVTNYFFDSVGRMRAKTDPLGNSKFWQYDALNRLTTVTNAIGGSVQYTYDDVGNRLTQVDENGNTTTYTYTNLNLVATKKDALLHSDEYTYDVAGQWNQQTDRMSQVTGISYDGLNRKTQSGFGATTSHPTSYTSTVGYTWDAGDRLTQMVDSVGGTITRTFDGLDDMTEEVTTLSTVDYTFDAGRRRTSMTVSGQPEITYTWDNANRLTQIQEAAGAINDSTVQTIGFSYDNAYRLSVITLANGSTITYAYDNASEITGITYSKSNTTAIGTLTYSYDDGGRRITQGGTLAGINLPNSITSSAHNANNQLTTWGSATLAYDENGNLTGDGTNTYTWDARLQLASISGGVSATFYYDAMRRRVGKTISGTTTGYAYDNRNYVQELNGITGGSSANANLITGIINDQVYARMTGSGGSTVIADFIPDANNNMIGLLNSSQTISDSYTYEAYGTSTHTGSISQSQQFTGRENDGTGLYFYRGRYYSPGTGRFISEDPKGWGGGQTDVYAYVSGDPIRKADPLGEQPNYMCNSAGIQSFCPSPPPPPPPPPPTPPTCTEDCDQSLSTCKRYIPAIDLSAEVFTDGVLGLFGIKLPGAGKAAGQISGPFSQQSEKGCDKGYEHCMSNCPPPCPGGAK